MPGPADYDNTDMSIKPLVLFADGRLSIPLDADAIAGYVSQVGDLWSGLKIGWVGSSAQEAHDFNDRWEKSMIAMFGRRDADPKQQPPPGENILGRIGWAVGGAAMNFAWADQNVKDMFKGFHKPDRKDLMMKPDTPPPHSDFTETGDGSGW
jgi:hypothetical protein